MLGPEQAQEPAHLEALLLLVPALPRRQAQVRAALPVLVSQRLRLDLQVPLRAALEPALVLVQALVRARHLLVLLCLGL